MNPPMMMARQAHVLLDSIPLTQQLKEELAKALLGTSLEHLARPESRVEITSFYALIEAIDAQLGARHPWWFLEVVERWEIKDFDVLGYLLYTSKHVGESLERFMQYRRLWSEGEELWMEQDSAHPEHVLICWRPLGPPRRAHEILGAMTAVDCVLGTNALLHTEEALDILSIHFCGTPTRGDTSRLTALFGESIPLSFGASHLTICMKRSSLSLPIASADDLLHAYFEQVALTRLAALPKDSVTANVRHLLFHHLPGKERPHIDQYSALLGMSSRSLQRALRQEDASFKQLVEEVLEELARGYLARGHSIQECCWMLSFSEPRAFHRAFKRWTGMTPSQWQKQAMDLKTPT